MSIKYTKKSKNSRENSLKLKLWRVFFDQMSKFINAGDYTNILNFGVIIK
jgi:hypothetical protein